MMKSSADEHAMTSSTRDSFQTNHGRHAGKSKLRFLWPILIIIGGFLFMKLMGTLKPPPAELEPVDIRRAVEVLEVTPVDTTLKIHTQGVVLPKNLTTVVGEVSGKITQISEAFNAGGYFEQGDVLLQIDPSDYSVAVRKAEAALAGREASLADAVARSEQAQKDWDKLERQGTPSPLVLRLPQLAEARANVSSAEADLAKAKRDLERTRIVAPYKGLVRVREADLGQYVTPGTTLGSIFAVETAQVRLPVTEDQYTLANWPRPDLSDQSYPNVRLEATVNGSPQIWPARIVRTEAMLDDMTRLNYVVAEVSNPYNLLGESHAAELKMGTFVEATIEGVAVEDVFILPRDTLLTDGRVMVIDDNDALAFKSVSILRSVDNQVFINGGLSAGDRVITTAIDLPVTGMSLRVDQDIEEQPMLPDDGPLMSSDLSSTQTEPSDGSF